MLDRVIIKIIELTHDVTFPLVWKSKVVHLLKTSISEINDRLDNRVSVKWTIYFWLPCNIQVGITC